MTPRERFLTAMRNQTPDRVPVVPDISNYIPCKLTGRPFWEIYWGDEYPLWRAYLQAADHYGIEHWISSCTGVPFVWPDTPCDWTVERNLDTVRDAMITETRVDTPDGPLTSREVCFRADPPSPVEKFIKDLHRDWPRYKHMMSAPTGINMNAWNEIKAECEKRDQAFGVGIGYPGFQSWMGVCEGGLELLSYAISDSPEILEEWHEIELENGTRQMELIITEKPDYILFGGSGTVTLASPKLANRYAIPALKRWSSMAREAGIATLLHSCGKSRALVDMLAEQTDVGCINPLEIAPMGDVDLAEVKRARGHQIALMGNLHTTDIMLYGTPDMVRLAALEAMRDAGVGGGFVLSTGDQCPRDTPEVNLRTMVETAHRYGVYAHNGTLPLVVEALERTEWLI